MPTTRSAFSASTGPPLKSRRDRCRTAELELGSMLAGWQHPDDGASVPKAFDTGVRETDRLELLTRRVFGVAKRQGLDTIGEVADDS